MLRASKVEEEWYVLITVDGQLSAEYVEVVAQCCEQAGAGGKPVHLLLRDVSLVDHSGRRLLQRLAAKGVCLRANGVYNSHLIRECRPESGRCDSKGCGQVTVDPF